MKDALAGFSGQFDDNELQSATNLHRCDQR
jgi:hypothetical protein